MKIVDEKPVAQGDLLLRRIEEIPAHVERVKAENGAYVLAHSETGHDHIVKEREDDVRLYQDLKDATIAYLEVIRADVLLEHQRSFDTHEPYTLPPGKYELRRQIESAPEGWRRAAD